VLDSVGSVVEFKTKELFAVVSEVVDNLNFHRKSVA
jgi:hypothetical protein